jgi:hypothetical protein
VLLAPQFWSISNSRCAASAISARNCARSAFPPDSWSLNSMTMGQSWAEYNSRSWARLEEPAEPRLMNNRGHRGICEYAE